MLKFSMARPQRRWALAAALFASGPLAWAQPVGSVQQDRQPTWQASQASTRVPPVAYRSVFADLPKGVESTVADWKEANANVGQFQRGHADLLKWEQEQAQKARRAQDAPPKAPAPTPPPAGVRP